MKKASVAYALQYLKLISIKSIKCDKYDKRLEHIAADESKESTESTSLWLRGRVGYIDDMIATTECDSLSIPYVLALYHFLAQYKHLLVFFAKNVPVWLLFIRYVAFDTPLSSQYSTLSSNFYPTELLR